MKRFSSIIFILLAFIIILAHSFIPHHFHDNIVCLESSFDFKEDHIHIGCNECSHKNSDKTHHHETKENHHDAKDNTDKCILSKIDFLKTNELKTELKSINCKYTVQKNISIQEASENLSDFKFKQNRYLHFYRAFIFKAKLIYTGNLSFRAPPIA